MKRMLIILALIVLVLAAYGCGQKQDDQSADKVPTEVKQAETMDSTRLDSATIDSTIADSAAIETVEEAHDSM